MCWAVLCFALNTGHAAAVLRLPLVNACLSEIADDKVVQVIQYSCFEHYQIVHNSGVGSVCMLCSKQSCWSWHPLSTCLKPYAYPVGRHLYKYNCQASCPSESVHLWLFICESFLQSHNNSNIASVGQSSVLRRTLDMLLLCLGCRWSMRAFKRSIERDCR
jgi:hypothetical protein